MKGWRFRCWQESSQSRTLLSFLSSPLAGEGSGVRGGLGEESLPWAGLSSGAVLPRSGGLLSNSLTSSPAPASALIASVVFQVARLVSIGQLPSGRIELARNLTPSRMTSWAIVGISLREKHWSPALRQGVVSSPLLHFLTRSVRTTVNARQAHHDKARQRRRFEIAAAVGLHPAEDTQAAGDGKPANKPSNRVPRRGVEVAGLADGDEGGNRVADDRHPDEAIPGLRHAGQFKRQRVDLAPVDQAGDRAVGHDRHDERFVDAITLAQASEAALLVDVSVGAVDQVGVFVRPRPPGAARRLRAWWWRCSNATGRCRRSRRRRSGGGRAKRRRGR